MKFFRRGEKNIRCEMCSSREAAVFFAEVFGPGLRHAAQGNIGKEFGYGREKSLIFCWNLRKFQRFAAMESSGGRSNLCPKPDRGPQPHWNA